MLLVQALVNVGRNYNGPKVLGLNFDPRRTGTVTGTIDKRKYTHSSYLCCSNAS